MVKISRLELIKFGKLHDCIIDLKDGLNVIYGDNEAGKSTIQLFIKAMFYGFPSRGGKKGDVKERERAIPWGETSAAGKIYINKDGRNIEIYRKFGKRASGDVIRVSDSATGEDYFGVDIKGDRVGELILGISQNMFERTVWIAQSNAPIIGKDDEITSKLINLLETGSESDVSIADATKALDTNMNKLRAPDKRRSPGEIDILLKKKSELIKQKEHIRMLESEQVHSKSKIKKCYEEKEKTEKQYRHLVTLRKSERAKEKLGRVNKLDGYLTKEMQIANTRQFQVFRHNASDEKIAQIRSDADRIDELEVTSYQKKDECKKAENVLNKGHQKQKKYIYIMIIASILMFGVGVFGYILDFPKHYLWITGEIIGFVVVIFAIVAYCIIRYNIVELKRKIEDYKNQIDDLRADVLETEMRFSESLKNLECDTFKTFNERVLVYLGDIEKIKMAQTLYLELLGDDDYDELKKEVAEISDLIIEESVNKNFDFDEQLNMLNEKRDRLSREITLLEQSLIKSDCDFINICDIDNNINAIESEIAEKEEEYLAYYAAKESLIEVYEKIKSDYTPLLNNETESLLSSLTDGKHGNIKISDDFTLNLNNSWDTSDVKRAEFFSSGTYNQIYLCLRLAIIKLTLRDSETIVFFDDILTTFDDARSEAAIKLINDICKQNEYQALLFTCHKRDIKSAKGYSDINIMEVIL